MTELTNKELLILGRKTVPVFKRGSQARLDYMAYERNHPEATKQLRVRTALAGGNEDNITDRYHTMVGFTVTNLEQH